MKINFSLDCTPEEARTFLGLPNVEKLQEDIMAVMRERITKGLAGEDLQALFKLWMPLSGSGWDEMQKMFWAAAAGTGPKKSGKN